jgi:histidinol-phosphate phosphatase family protein
VHLLVERGIVGLAAFLFLFIVFFERGLKKIRLVPGSERFLIAGSMLAVCGFLMSGLTEYSFGDSEIQMSLWFIMALPFYKSRAVFLDRDGTLNEDMHYSADLQKLKIFPFAAEAVRLLNSAGYRVIIITNQSGVARGCFTMAEVTKVNDAVISDLKENGAVIDGVYVCPHHPDDYCNCRKPGIGMIMKAKADFNIDLKNSYVVGDMNSDVQLAANAGAGGVFVFSGAGKAPPDFAVHAAQNVLEAAKWITGRST